MQILKAYTFKCLLFLVIAGVLSLVSCKAKNKLVTNTSNTYVSIDSILENLKKPLEYEWYEAKSKIKIESSLLSEKGKLFLRIRKDSAILSAVKKFSFEGGRSLITQDSVFYINRLDQTYQASSIDTMKALYGISPDFNYIESLHAGTIPYTNQPILDTKEVESETIVRVMINEMLHVMTFDRYTGLLKGVQFKDRFNIEGQWTYSDYRYLNDTLALPFYREFEVSLNPMDSVKLTLEFSNIELNKPKKISFSIPQSYSRLY